MSDYDKNDICKGNCKLYKLSDINIKLQRRVNKLEIECNYISKKLRDAEYILRMINSTQSTISSYFLKYYDKE